MKLNLNSSRVVTFVRAEAFEGQVKIVVLCGGDIHKIEARKVRSIHKKRSQVKKIVPAINGV